MNGQQKFTPATLGPDLLARQLRLQQQAQSASQDLEAAKQPLQGQMVSGHYVAPSWAQYVGQALNQFDAQNRMESLPDQYAELQGLQQQGDMARFGLGVSPQALAAGLSGESQIPLLPGRDAAQSYQAYSMLGPQEYMKSALSQGAPTDIQRNLRAAGVQEGSPEWRQALMEHANPGQRPTSLMQNLQAAGLKPGSPEYRDAVLAGTRGTTVNVGAGEKAWDTESAKLFARRYDDITAGAQNAQQMMGMYELAEQALASGVRTGVGAEAELSLRQLGSALGLNTDPDKLAGGELIRAVQNRMALTMRSPDGGMGMPGALSDRDIKFLKDSQIGIDRSPEGNRRMLSAFRAMEQRKIDIARLADDYIAQSGRLDAGFNRTVREFADSNPIFAAQGADRMQQLDQMLGL